MPTRILAFFMKITIDNLKGTGAADYTTALDTTVNPRVERKLNEPSIFRCTLVIGSGMPIPGTGARISVLKENGEFLFTGYLTAAPDCEYLGRGEAGPVYRYALVAESDEVVLDQKALVARAPFLARSAGSALKELVESLAPGKFDTSGVEEMDVLATYAANPQKKFSEHAGEIARLTRGSYRVMNGAVTLGPVGKASYRIQESAPAFSPGGLKLRSPDVAINDVTLIGMEEPQAYVRDYFVGDGFNLHFYLSQQPFQQSRRALIDERYTTLDPATWKVNDPASSISAGAGVLQINGGNGGDGETTLSFVEQIELGGALELQHGDVSFAGASSGIIGGLYAGNISSAGCLAGFQVTPSGSASSIQALINGVVMGPVLVTTAGHRYLLTTYIYSQEVYRSGERYHSSRHPAGDPRGGAAIPANVRVVLEVQDANPAVPQSLIAPGTVLFDDVIPAAPGFCSYALINAMDMQCSIASTYLTHIASAEVRTALPNQAYETRLVESLADGGECAIVSSSTLDFYPQYVPPLDTYIVASFRGRGRAVAQVADEAAIARARDGGDNGVRGIVASAKAPSARTQMDCENAALAILDDAGERAWTGTYETWSDFLPDGASDIFPGDGVDLNVPSRSAVFSAVVRRVEIDVADPANDRGRYKIEFGNDLAQPLAMQTEQTGTQVPLQDLPVRLRTGDVGSYYPASLANAQVTQVSSTTVQVDIGMAVPSGCGIEVRTHDFDWGPGNDRSLLGRFGGRTLTLPRLGRIQTYFLRLYDSSSPPHYSRYAAALHVDYPYA